MGLSKRDFINILLALMPLAAFAGEPVWHEGHAGEMNEQLVFSGSFDVRPGITNATLTLAASNPFKIAANGVFVGYGPARGPNGLFRRDVWNVPVRTGRNEIVIECSGNNAKSYYFQKQPSFLQAEVVLDGKTVMETSAKPGPRSFSARLSGRIRKVPRFSSQRMFCEAYCLPAPESDAVSLARCPPVKLLPRRVPAPCFDVCRDFKPSVRGTVGRRTDRGETPAHVAQAGRDPAVSGFRTEDLDVDLYAVAGSWDLSKGRPFADEGPVKVASGEFVQFEHPVARTGFPGLKVVCEKPGDLYLAFGETLVDGHLDSLRGNMTSAVLWRFEKPGVYEVETFEPYSAKALAVVATGGRFRVFAPTLRLYRNAESPRAKFHCSDEGLERIFRAAEETFAQNAVDVFTDCPSRERAGWLCDSYFTARVSDLLTGNGEYETLFLENFAKAADFAPVPEGMFPMCYPADFPTGRFIPSWAMFLVLQLDEYVRLRGGDPQLAEALRPRVFALVDFLKKYRNADGLLEKLPSWVFVEWSKAAAFVQDVNYPNNMVWAATLDAVDRLYGRKDLASDAARTRETIRRQSWSGDWFRDHAVRDKDGRLVVRDDRSETCQYYAFYFGIATPSSHPDLWRRLVREFGPRRAQTGLYPEIHPSNAFIGNYLRLECLSRAGLSGDVLDELRGFFLGMADRTGTLWEHDRPRASCIHGFASHAAVSLIRDIVGIRRIDRAAKTVLFVPPRGLRLASCEVTLPAADGEIVCGWQTENGVPKSVCRAPAGWSVRLPDEDPWPDVTPEWTPQAASAPAPTESVTVADVARGWEKPVTSSVRTSNGMPLFCVNGTPEFIVSGTRSTFGDAPRQRPTGNYSYVTVWAHSRQFNPRTGEWNFAYFDELAKAAHRTYPKARFIWQLIVYPPPDWGRAHPDERVHNEKGVGEDGFWGGSVTAYSFSSEKARAVLCEQVSRAIAALEASPYANRIAAYRLASGDTLEWLGFPEHDRLAHDFSPPALSAFRAWAARRYPELADPTPPTWRQMHAKDGGDLLWDRKRHLSEAAFQEFHSEAVADTLIAVARAAKAATGGRKAVGAYHGYTFFLNNNGCSQHRAHFAFKKVLDSGALDFVVSPQSYAMRRPGGAFGDMKPFATIRHHGLLSVCENDLRTCHGPCAGVKSFGQLPTFDLSVGQIRRDFAVELCRGNPLLHLAIQGTDWLFPSAQAEIDRFRILGDSLLKKGFPARRAEIALVASEKSIVAMPMIWAPTGTGVAEQSYDTNGCARIRSDGQRNLLTGELFDGALEKWARVGAPVDYLLAEDLADHPGDYKLYVFLNAVAADDKLVRAVCGLRERGATLVWLWAPGWTDGIESGSVQMRALTGLDLARQEKPMVAGVTMKDDGRFMGQPDAKVSPLFAPTGSPSEVLGTYANGQPGLAVFRQGKSTCVFSGGWTLDVPFMRELARRAGVFVYSDTTDPLEANEKLLTLHARFAGRKSVRLPRKTTVLDVVSGRIVAQNADRFEFDMKLHDTALFYLSDDVAELRGLLNGHADGKTTEVGE